MIQCIIQFLSGQHTHRYTSTATQRHTPGDLRKSKCPGGRKSYEHLRGRWRVGKNRVGCLSCCECNLFSARDCTSWKEPLAVCVCEYKHMFGLLHALRPTCTRYQLVDSFNFQLLFRVFRATSPTPTTSCC